MRQEVQRSRNRLRRLDAGSSAAHACERSSRPRASCRRAVRIRMSLKGKVKTPLSGTPDIRPPNWPGALNRLGETPRKRVDGGGALAIGPDRPLGRAAMGDGLFLAHPVLESFSATPGPVQMDALHVCSGAQGIPTQIASMEHPEAARKDDLQYPVRPAVRPAMQYEPAVSGENLRAMHLMGVFGQIPAVVEFDVVPLPDVALVHSEQGLPCLGIVQHRAEVGVGPLVPIERLPAYPVPICFVHACLFRAAGTLEQ